MPGATFTQASRRGGVREGEVEAGVVDLGRVRHLHGAAEVERGEVGLRDRHSHRVQVDPGADQAGPGGRDHVAPDAASQVDHRLRAERGVAARAMRGDREAGGLLQRVGGEVEAVREVAVLAVRLAAELHLRERGRGPLGRRRTTEGGPGGEVAGAVLDQGGGLREQRLPVVGQQPAEGLQVHPTILPVPPALALDCGEC
jgi:hypothetical protein